MLKDFINKSRKGELKYLTDDDDLYEEPTNPDLKLNTAETSVSQWIYEIIQMLVKNRVIELEDRNIELFNYEETLDWDLNALKSIEIDEETSKMLSLQLF